jgi:phytoene dehydrogenase-like protein
VRGGADAALQQWVAAATPVTAACLDVALQRLPQPRTLFALGIDQPLYLSVHSAVARLAPAGAATIQVAKYLPVRARNDPRADERELEGLLDLMQPGWRDAVVERRFLPSMVVYNALVTAVTGGIAGRPGPAVPDIKHLYVVGDWVGPEGLLADASLASAKRAAELIVRSSAQPAAVAA